MPRPTSSLKHLHNGKGEIIDYSNARIACFELAVNYYGAAGGGPWIGFHGIPSALSALAAAGNTIALCMSQNIITDESGTSALKALERAYNQIGRQADPF